MRRIRFTLILLLTLALALTGKIYYDTNSIEVRHFRIENSPLGDALAGMKLAFLTDLHAREIGPREKRILDILEKETPDLILLGGDYIDFRGSYEPALSFFNGLKNAYAVMGNTEYTNENGSCILCHQDKSKALKEKPQPVFLRNTAATVNYRGKVFNLLGVYDPVEKKSDLHATIQKGNPSKPTILIAHSPEIFEEAADRGIDFILSGHNHGGQIFFTRYLRKMIFVDPALEYLEGFFQKGKTLMYVSRGIGTSFLPFRLGVKPEITFFEFANIKAESTKSLRIANSPGQTLFAGFTLSNYFRLFDVFHGLSNRSDSWALMPAPGILFDFEKEKELENLNWQCPKWFELSSAHATSGEYSLKAIIPPGQYPGISFKRIQPDWSGYRFLKMDIFNPAEETFAFHVRIDDEKSRWAYADRYDGDFEVKTGKNSISIPLDSVKTNLNPRSLNLRKIERFMVFLPDNAIKREFYLDNVRLE